MHTRLNNICRELPFTRLKLVKIAWAAIHWFPGFLPLLLKSSRFAVISVCLGKKAIIIPFLCVPVSLESWKFGDDNFLFLLIFFILLPFISMRIHVFNLILLPCCFAFESMVYFPLQDDKFFQAPLSLKNNLFHVSSACVLSSFSILLCFLVSIYLQFFFFAFTSLSSLIALVN